jgi:UDP-N-acetyl-D-glucosamine dehydrogenase
MGMDRDARIAIIGLGYVGLPLAIAFEEAGLQVVGIDASEARVAELVGGTSPIDDISDERLRAALAKGLRIASPAEGGLREADTIFVCVPTPISDSKDPDLGPVLGAARPSAGAFVPATS